MLINKEQITTIIVKDKLLSTYPYYYRESYYKKRWFRKPKYIKASFIDMGYFNEEHEINKLPIEYSFNPSNNKIYLKDRIYINMSDGKQKEIYFNTIEERDTYINIHFNDNKYLKIHE